MTATTAAQETAYKQKFEEFITGEHDARVAEFRRKAFDAFCSLGFPDQKMENWKYTSVTPIASQDWTVTPADTTSSDITGAEDEVRKFNLNRSGFTALNAAFGSYSVITITKETVVDEPIHITFGSAKGVMTSLHVIVIAEAGSKATIVETHHSESEGFTNAAVQVFVKDNANVTHYRVQKDTAGAFNYGVTEVTLGRGSSYNSTNINLGGAVSRHDIEVRFTAEGGEAWVDGLYMLNGEQHHDTHSIIDHTVPNCTSHQTYRGVLNDRSHGVFNGIVFVRENAHGTDAQQSNKNLLLSNDARIDTKPQLEIFNDDVKCSHGATVGQLEDDEMFYLLSRGISEPLAKNLLTYGFAEAVIDKIAIDSIKNELDKLVLNRLGTEI